MNEIACMGDSCPFKSDCRRTYEPQPEKARFDPAPLKVLDGGGNRCKHFVPIVSNWPFTGQQHVCTDG